MRLIDADALEKALGDWIRDHWTDAFTGDDAGSEFADMIDHAKTIDSVPVVHAHWVTAYPNSRCNLTGIIEEDFLGKSRLRQRFKRLWGARRMTIEERNNKLKYLITCMKCEVSGKCCDENCPTQYDAGHTGEIIENLEEISKILEQEPAEIVRCKDCKHRPVDAGSQIEPPKVNGRIDETCPCINEDDGWYSYIPEDDFYCADGERKE